MQVRILWIGAAISGVLVLAGGCESNTCDAGTKNACDDSRTIAGCSLHTSYDDENWRPWSTSCAAVHGTNGTSPHCVLKTDGIAMCSQRAERAPECNVPAHAGGAMFCVGNVVSVCDDGFLATRKPCEPDRTGKPTRCIESTDAAGEACSFCTSFETPDACPPGARYWCLGDALVECDCGRMGRIVDSCPHACVSKVLSVTFAVAFCAESSDVDPTCTEATGGYKDGGSYCDGNTAVTCKFDWAVRREHCKPNFHCEDGPARCVHGS